MFHPGETLIHEFIIPFIYDTIEKVLVTYKQNDRLILIKEITSFAPYIPEDEEAHDNPRETVPIANRDIDYLFYDETVSPLPGETNDLTMLICQLSQEDSLLFDNFDRVKIQLNVYCYNGSRAVSDEFPVSSGAQHYKVVMDDE